MRFLNQERGRRKSKPRAASPAEFRPTAPLQDVNPAIAATAKALRKAKPDADQVVRANGQGHCGIEVGAPSVERTIAILDAIARALDACGLKIEPLGKCMRVALPPDNLTFSLVERIERRNHAPTMEELSREERRRKKLERDARLGVWSYGQQRAYPEFDFVRTGELSIQIADEYVRGLRRNWSDGKRQKIERLVDDIVVGITTYLTGVKAKREQRERWHRERERRQRLAALARAREEREAQRHEYLKRLAAISTEADELKSLLARLRDRLPAHPSGELASMLEWTEGRLVQLEDELTPDGIASELRERQLFPDVDELSAPKQDED